MSDSGAGLRLIDLPRTGPPPAPRVPAPIRWTLPNGLRVVAVPRPGIPQVGMRLLLPAGAAADSEAYPGTAALVGALLTEGTAGLSADELNERLDWLGASLSVQVGHDYAEMDLVLLSDTLEAGLALFAEVVRRPSFPERETERTRAETLDSLLARLDEPANAADDAGAAAVFGAHHPYGRLTTGTPDGVASVPREELAAFHEARYRPEGSVLLVAGDFDPDGLARVLEAELGGWSGVVSRPPYPPDPPQPVEAGRLVSIPWADAAQGEIRFAGTGMPRAAPDWIAGAVANYVLGGSTITGRLGANLREDKGWTYGVRSGFAAGVRAAGWVIDTAVDAAVVPAALEEISSELERFANESISAEELRRAQHAMILSLPRAFETPGRIVSRFATLEAFGLPADYWDRYPEQVRAVTAEDVLRMARMYFSPDRLVRVTVGPEVLGDG